MRGYFRDRSELRGRTGDCAPARLFGLAGVPQARLSGLVKPEPQETPFSFIETYGPPPHSDPVYHEHFAISDVPAGEYVLGVESEGRRVYRRIWVKAGKLTWVEFRPDAY